MALASGFSGFCVGWSVFSGIDQNRTVRSVHMLDGLVRRDRLPGVSSRSLGRPRPSQYGATTWRLSLTLSALNTELSETVQYQMSSEQFFQFLSDPRPFSLSQVIRLSTAKRRWAAVKIADDDLQCPQMVTEAVSLRTRDSGASQDSSHRSYSGSGNDRNEAELKVFDRL